MLYFVVEICELKACQHWRLGDNCVKNHTSIAESVKYCSNLHDSARCQVRKQIDNYRLEQMLEGDSK